MPTIRVSHEFHGYSDYWGGNGRRWDAGAGCLFAFYGPDTSLKDCVDQWVDDFWQGGDFESHGDGPDAFEDVTQDDLREAILQNLLNDRGRADYESGALCEFAADCEIEYESAEDRDDVDVGDEVKIDNVDDGDAFGEITMVTYHDDGIRSIFVDVDGRVYRRDPEDVYYRTDGDDYTESPVWIILVEIDVCEECGKGCDHTVDELCADCGAKHYPDDFVECSDGTVRYHADVHYDCRGGAHGSDDDRMESNVAIVTEILESHDKSVTEYTTENSDYPDGYAYICNEDAPNWRNRFEEYVRERLEAEFEFDGDAEGIAREVYKRLNAGMDVEAEYDHNEYACYDGPGFCPFSLEIGEYENQIEVSAHKELQALHDAGELDDVLDYVNCDVHISRSHRREKNEQTGYYENVGRETYMPCEHSRNHPTINAIHSPGGQWHYVFSAESVDQMIEDELERLAYWNENRRFRF